MNRRQKIEQLLEKEPDDAFLRFGLAMELLKEGESLTALDQFDRVLAIDSVYTAAYHHKGYTLIALERIEEARSVLQAGIEAATQIGNNHAKREMSELLESIS